MKRLVELLFTKHSVTSACLKRQRFIKPQTQLGCSHSLISVLRSESVSQLFSMISPAHAIYMQIPSQQFYFTPFTTEIHHAKIFFPAIYFFFPTFRHTKFPDINKHRAHCTPIVLQSTKFLIKLCVTKFREFIFRSIYKFTRIKFSLHSKVASIQ